MFRRLYLKQVPVIAALVEALTLLWLLDMLIF